MSRATTPTKSRALHGKNRNKKWARHPDDWYVEESWCDTRLFEAEEFEGRIWDPAAGIGRIPTAAQAAGHEAVAGEIVDRGCADYIGDFRKCWEKLAPNIVCNVPFGIAEEFVPHALKLADRKVAMLLPSNWIQGDERSRWLETTPLRRVWYLTPRPSMPPGPVIVAGEKPSNGTTDYAWFVWLKGYDGYAETRWLRRDDGATHKTEFAQRDREQFMGPEQKARATIKRSGKLKPTKGLPLFNAKKKPVTRDSAEERT